MWAGQPQERQEFRTYQRLEVRSRRVSACCEGNKLRQEGTCLASDHRPLPIPVDKGRTRKGPCLPQSWTGLLCLRPSLSSQLPDLVLALCSVAHHKASSCQTLPPFQFYHPQQTEHPRQGPDPSLELSVRTKISHHRTGSPPWSQPFCPMPWPLAHPRASLIVCLAIPLGECPVTPRREMPGSDS